LWERRLLFPPDAFLAASRCFLAASRTSSNVPINLFPRGAAETVPVVVPVTAPVVVAGPVGGVTLLIL
jgi:hypothetical protein